MIIAVIGLNYRFRLPVESGEVSKYVFRVLPKIYINYCSFLWSLTAAHPTHWSKIDFIKLRNNVFGNVLLNLWIPINYILIQLFKCNQWSLSNFELLPLFPWCLIFTFPVNSHSQNNFRWDSSHNYLNNNCRILINAPRWCWQNERHIHNLHFDIRCWK